MTVLYVAHSLGSGLLELFFLDGYEDILQKNGSSQDRNLALTVLYVSHLLGSDPFWIARSGCCRANVAHIRQSWPDSGLGVQVKVLEAFSVVPSSLSFRACVRHD